MSVECNEQDKGNFCSCSVSLLNTTVRYHTLSASGHYMYRTVVTICTAQRSLYMYRTVVTTCTAQWSLYVPHSGHYMYRTAVTIGTAQ